eukprot:2921583-Heterocapsa_arctica.AAC.1
MAFGRPPSPRVAPEREALGEGPSVQSAEHDLVESGRQFGDPLREGHGVAGCEEGHDFLGGHAPGIAPARAGKSVFAECVGGPLLALKPEICRAR